MACARPRSQYPRKSARPPPPPKEKKKKRQRALVIGTIRFTRPIPFILLLSFSNIISGISFKSKKAYSSNPNSSYSQNCRDIEIRVSFSRWPWPWKSLPLLESKRDKRGGDGWIFGGPPEEEADGHETGVIGEPSRLLPRSPLSPRYRFRDPRIGRFLRYLESRRRTESCPSNATRRGLACLDRLVTHLLSPFSVWDIESCERDRIGRV